MSTNKQAVNSKQDNTLNVQTVLVGKHTASFLVPDYNEGQKLSVIDEGVLKYLKALLPKANTYEIIDNFIERMQDIRKSPCTLEAAVAEAKDFVAFHESVNLMERYFDPKVDVKYDEPFNVEKPEPTAKELFEEWVKMGDVLKSAVGQHGEGYETLKQFEDFMMNSHTGVTASEEHVTKTAEVVAAHQRP